MSSWDHGEVLALKTRGNEYARRVWLANAPPVGEQGRPKEGDDINVFKRFVVEAYENKSYYVEPVEGEDYSGAQVSARMHKPATGRVITSHKPNVALQQNAFPASAPMIPPQPVRVAPVAVPAPAPAVDLLDFGAFDTPPNAQFGQSAVTNTAPAGDLFDPFNTNPPASAPVAPPAPPAAPMQANNANTFGGNASFDPFGIMGSTPSQPALAPTIASQPIVPVMNSFNGIYNNAMDSMMNGGMNMMNNVMMNGMNNTMNNPMMQNHMQQNAFGMGGGMPSYKMGMMNNNMTMGNANMMGNNMMNSMNISMGTPMGGGQKTLSTPQPAMNMNIMQPMNNQISSNFGSSPKKAGASDPFAGLGF